MTMVSLTELGVSTRHVTGHVFDERWGREGEKGVGLRGLGTLTNTHTK